MRAYGPPVQDLRSALAQGMPPGPGAMTGSVTGTGRANTPWLSLAETRLRAQSVRYDKTILVSTGHTSAPLRRDRVSGLGDFGHRRPACTCLTARCHCSARFSSQSRPGRATGTQPGHHRQRMSGNCAGFL